MSQEVLFQRIQRPVLIVIVTHPDADIGYEIAVAIRDKARNIGLRAIGPRPMAFRRALQDFLQGKGPPPEHVFRVAVFTTVPEISQRFINELRQMDIMRLPPYNLGRIELKHLLEPKWW